MSQSKSNSIEFRLFAPYNEEVALVGDWNEWQKIPMQKDEKGWWRTQVPLADGDYQYKFVVKSKSWFMPDQEVQIFDPYGPCITEDSAENTCLFIRDGKPIVTSYEWKHDDKPLPSNNELVIYELHIGDFSGGPGDEPNGKRRKGRFVDVIEKLDYLAELGINAIEFMPFKEFPGERSWGYNPRSLFAIENSYGSPDELARLVDECHAHGIRVFMDGVYNHSEAKAPLTQIDHDYWYYHNNPDPENMRWGPKFNFEHRDENLGVWPARQYVADSIKYWIDVFHIDGIRFDATAAIRNFDFMHWLRNEIYAKIGGIKPFYAIAEHIPQDPAITGTDGPMDAAWHEHFYRQLACTAVGVPHQGREPFNLEALVNVIDPRRDGFSGALNVVNYLNSHDEDRIMWQIGQVGKLVDDPAFRRNKLGAALLMTAPGVPMLWMGEEFAESAPKTIDRQPIDWALLQNERNADLRRYYTGLMRLRRHTPALQGDTIEFILREPERGLLGFKRWDAAGGVVVVVANLKDMFAGAFSIANAGLEDGTWHEYRYDFDVPVQGGVLRDTLAESDVKIYIKK